MNMGPADPTNDSESQSAAGDAGVEFTPAAAAGWSGSCVLGGKVSVRASKLS